MNAIKREELIGRLDLINQLAKGSRLARLLHQPVEYASVLIFNKLIYPMRKKGRFAVANTFFDTEMEILLPSGTDIKLLGAKSDPSEIRLAKFLCRRLGEGQVFLDIGAHLGFFSQLAASLTGESGRVLAIEASANTFPVLENNLKKFRQAQCFHLAAGDETKEISFSEFPVLYSEYNTIRPEQFEKEAWYKKLELSENQVQMRRMDEWLAEQHIVPDLIKIDAEGAEDLVIVGLEGILENFQGGIIMEFLSPRRMNAPHLRALNFLQQKGYMIYVLDEAGDLNNIPSVSDYFEMHGLESENLVFFKGG